MQKLDLVLKIVQTVATLAIGVAASFLAYRQYKISQTKLRLDLYEKRLTLFRLAIEFVEDFGKGDYKDSVEIFDRLSKFRSDTIEHLFLFDDPAIHECFSELYEKTNKLGATLAVLHIPKTLPRGYETELQRRYAEECAWFMLQESRLIELFKADLSIRTLQ